MKTLRELKTSRNTWRNVELYGSAEEATAHGFALMYDDERGSVYGIRDAEAVAAGNFGEWEKIAFVPCAELFDAYNAEAEETDEKESENAGTVCKREILETVAERLSDEPQSDIAIDFCADYSASDSEYICDAFSDYADRRVDIYTADLWRWAADNYEYIDQARNEFGPAAEILDDIRAGEYLKNETDLSEDAAEIYKTLAREYIGNVILDDITTTAERLGNAIDDLEGALDMLDSGDRIDAIADACNDFIKALADESE